MKEFLIIVAIYSIIGTIVIGILCGIDKEFKPKDDSDTKLLTVLFTFWPLVLAGLIGYGIFYGVRYVTRKIVLDFEESKKKQEELKRHKQNTPPVSITEQVL